MRTPLGRTITCDTNGWVPIQTRTTMSLSAVLLNSPSLSFGSTVSGRPCICLSPLFGLWTRSEICGSLLWRCRTTCALNGKATSCTLPTSALQREYAEAMVKRRLHQPMFRYRVLTAYASQCALCRLRHKPLLDAAHIKEDRDGGEPIVPNGVAMCAIHHRAFDNAVLGIRPDYVVEIRPDVMEEVDGPTLLHALQGLHHARLHLPRSRPAWPREDLLEERYERFRAAS